MQRLVLSALVASIITFGESLLPRLALRLTYPVLASASSSTQITSLLKSRQFDGVSFPGVSFLLAKTLPISSRYFQCENVCEEILSGRVSCHFVACSQ